MKHRVGRASGSVRPKIGGLAGVLAQASVVSAAFGKWPGFVLMMTALAVILALSFATVMTVGKATERLIGAVGYVGKLSVDWQKLHQGHPLAPQANTSPTSGSALF
jgi:hypothetical protein